MEEEIEDIVGDVKLTDSQKSVATSNVYSMDFTDSSSDKNNSSGKDTYVIELDDSDDTESYPIHEDKTVIDLNYDTKNNNAKVHCAASESTKVASTNMQSCSVVSQEIFTQTSKTIFQLAAECINKESLETQTSFVSITENRCYDYKIQLSNGKKYEGNNYQTVLTNALDDESSKFQESDSETIKSDDNSCEVNSEDMNINIGAEAKDNIQNDDNQEIQYQNTSDESNDSDMDEDSLMEIKGRTEIDTRSDNSEPTKSVDNEIEDLYNKLSKTIELHGIGRHEPETHYSRALTPLTEESITKRDSLNDASSEKRTFENIVEEDKDVLFTNFAGGQVKMLPIAKDIGEFRLPPIQNRSCPNSPHLNFLFSVHPSNRLGKAGTLPCLYEASERGLDRWEIGTKELASGESPLISGKSDPVRSNGSIHLPPIHIEGYVVKSKISKTVPQKTNDTNASRTSTEIQQDAINIKEKIKELKMVANTGRSQPRIQSKYNASLDSRSCSPSSGESQESKLCDAVERGCEALCAELLRRLRSASWLEVSDTLGEIPKVMGQFWAVITEQRIADLIRQVSAHIESPRTQVARIACSTLASILKNTTYTKKPDFYEAVTVLLMKTGSFSRPVRRAANVALDEVVSGAELSHAVTALCLHGVDHKSPLVRSAAARLLVVSCALAGGGRDLLRARPPTAAGARRHALRSLAVLLDDKSTDARKYAERLYAMLRPLANFEAYYLTDVEVEIASRQMRKYDRLLLCEPPKDAR